MCIMGFFQVMENNLILIRPAWYPDLHKYGNTNAIILQHSSSFPVIFFNKFFPPYLLFQYIWQKWVLKQKWRKHTAKAKLFQLLELVHLPDLVASLDFFSSSVLHSLFSWSASQSQTVKRLNRTNSKCTSLCLVFLPGLSGTVCRPAQPANPSRAVQLPALQILHRSPVSLHPHGGALLTGLIHTDPRSATVVAQAAKYLSYNINISVKYYVIATSSYFHT